MAAAAQPAAGPIGEVFKNRYRILKELGVGGFATAYLAQDEELLSRPVVVKILHSSRADAWFLRKFQQEKEALARIDHPGVVAILDAGETPRGMPFIVVQFVDGVTLRNVIRAALGKIELGWCAKTVRQIGSALQAAHDKGVYHRDLKPENIMVQNVNEDAHVKLIDFGIAAIANSVYDSPDHSTRVAGTIRYMPPEQIEGRSSAESDIYAFGVIVYEMLTGRTPVESPWGLVGADANRLIVKPRDLRPEIPEEAQAIILKALSFDADQRYHSARTMGDCLGEALHSSKSACG
jgi:serine/threonine-protein kinase